MLDSLESRAEAWFVNFDTEEVPCGVLDGAGDEAFAHTEANV